MTQRKRTAKQLARTAYHEAGHAYAHWKLNLPWKHVTIEETDRYLGLVVGAGLPGWFNPEPDPREYSRNHKRTWLRIQRECQCFLAGPIAEKRFAGRCNRSTDYNKAVDFASHYIGRGKVLNAWLRCCQLATEEMFLEPGAWEAVTALANALIENPKIKRPEAEKIILRAQDSLFNRDK